MIERTLILIKPDAVQRSLVGEILSRFERCGLKFVGMKLVSADSQTVSKHYDFDDEWYENVGKTKKENLAKQGTTTDKSHKELGLEVYQLLVNFLVKSPIVALVLEGHDAIAHVRKLVGATSPQASAPGTIRGDYSFDTYELANHSNRSLYNIIHASSSVEDANKEISLWFKPEELHKWERIDEVILYDGLNKEK